ncbi:sigma 54-interacting transcriptional regulator [Desulfarculus baarsii]
MKKNENRGAALVVDEGPDRFSVWQEALVERGFNFHGVASPDEAVPMADQHYFDLMFVRETIAGRPTDELLARLLDMMPESVATVLADDESVDRAVRAMRLGAFNYIRAPRRKEEALGPLEEALEYRRLRRDGALRRRQLNQKYDVDNIVGASQAMQDVFRLIHKVARADSTVLILGESGTGKELVARAIHHQSRRADRPLVPVNCGAIPEDLLESELFGHEKGAFTGAIKTRAGRFELAEGGTIFLDEVGDMSPQLQVKLLRVLQEHQFERVGGGKTIDADIRVLAATNRDLREMVATGHFREDLYYRLNVVPIRVPPLRQRRSDIPLLCGHFIQRLSRQKGLEPRTIHPEVMGRLMRYAWPGNVRELENMLERMCILADGEVIGLDDLPVRLAALEPGPPPDEPERPAEHQLPLDGLDFNEAVDSFERALIVQALERTNWVKNQAAALLRLNRTTLVEKIKKKGIKCDE